MTRAGSGFRSWQGLWVRLTLPRRLNPIAWWVYAFGLAAAASLTSNVLVLGLLIGTAAVVVGARRGTGAWGDSFRIYLALGAFVIIIRVLFRVVFGGSGGGQILIPLPALPFGGIQLLGPVTSDALLAGFTDGLRLAAIIICIGAANSLANPLRLLAQLPPALYEVGATLVISVNVFAQLAGSVRRVRQARLLRATHSAGRPGRGRVLQGVVVPVITDALDRSMLLAAAMDARGYGRTVGLSPGRRYASTASILMAMIGLAIGAYLFLAPPTRALGSHQLLLAGLFLVLAAACGVLGFWLVGSTVRRTRYRPEGWHAAETLVVACGVAPAVVCWWLLIVGDAGVLSPAVAEWPRVTAGLLIAIGLALLPAVFAPRPPSELLAAEAGDVTVASRS